MMSFLEVHSLGVNQQAKVTDYMSPIQGRMLWEPNLKREVFSWEVLSIINFLGRLELCHPTLENEDRKALA